MPELTDASWEKRLNCVARFMLLGNMRVVSEQTGVHYNTLMDWKRSSWWPEMVEQLRRQKKQKTNDSITKVVEQSLEIMQDRLDNGDPFFNQKTGKVEYKPVGIRDVTTIASSLLQRQIQLEEVAQRSEVKTDTVQETLSLLAKEFQKWNKSTPEVIDVEDAVVLDPRLKNLKQFQPKREEHAIHDQRETRLQEGGRPLYEQALSNPEASGAEQGTSNHGESREST